MDRSGLRLIQGGGMKSANNYSQGPITRMDLWSRFQPTTSKLYAFAIFSKLALIASLLYFLLGRR